MKIKIILIKKYIIKLKNKIEHNYKINKNVSLYINYIILGPNVLFKANDPFKFEKQIS